MNRKGFVVAGTAAAVASVTLPSEVLACAEPEPADPQPRPYAPILLRGDYDHAAMMRAIDNPATHKQIFLSNPDLLGFPGVSATFMRMVNAWNAYDFSLDVAPQRENLAVVGVLISKPVVFALNDAMWSKYRIAQIFKITDRTGATAKSNPTRAAWGSLDLSDDVQDADGMYHDFSSDALRRRGAKFLVCHNALTGISAGFVKSSGIAHAEIVRDWTKNVLPEFTVVPAGGMAVQLAQERGWKLYPVTD